MMPIIALVGRPNVGKSTLFNRLTNSRDALVSDFAGLTRDRLCGKSILDGYPVEINDTSGIQARKPNTPLDSKIFAQTIKAIIAADLLLFVVDGRCGLTLDDISIVRQLYIYKKSTIIVINKTENMEANLALSDFFGLGLDALLVPISAMHNRGVANLAQQCVILLRKNGILNIHKDHHSVTNISAINENSVVAKKEYKFLGTGTQEKKKLIISVAVIGRPNVGKSSLINALLGEDRTIVCDLPGTTRDRVTIPFKHNFGDYELIDTAGVRRRTKINEKLEQSFVAKSLQSVEKAQVILMVIDAVEGLVSQDFTLLNFIISHGRPLVLIVNKWDCLTPSEKINIKDILRQRLRFINFVRIHYVCALQGVGTNALLSSINSAYNSACCKVSTNMVNRILQQAQALHAPPLVRGRRIKLKYAHMGGESPPTIVIHGNQLNELPKSYRRYLINTYQRMLKIKGAFINLKLCHADNPYTKNN